MVTKKSSPIAKAASVQLWWGADEPRLMLEVERWVGLFHEKHPEAQVVKLELEKGTDESALAEKLHQAARGGGLFTSQQLIILKGFNSAEAKGDLLTLAKEVVVGPPAGAVVLVVEPGRLAWSKPLAAALKRAAEKDEVVIKEFFELEPAELERWVVARAKALGTVVSAQVARQLAGAVKGDMRRLEQELAKFAAYRPGAEVKLSDLDIMVQREPEDDVFAFVDCVARRDWAQAQVVLSRQFDLGTSPQNLVGLLAWQLRVLASVRQALDSRTERRSASELASELELKPFVVTKALQQIPYYSADKLAWLMGELSELDYALKSRPTDPQVLFGLFLSKLNTLHTAKEA